MEQNVKIPEKIGIVLSGGGIRGVAHAGILKALEENGIEPAIISGSSSGAMAGVLYAAGYKPEEIVRFFKENDPLFKWRLSSLALPGILDAEKYAEVFKRWLDGRNFANLDKKLHICVTDVLHGTIRFFSTGELVQPVLASAAVPGFFSPVEMEGTWYIDGGTMNNFPVEPLIGDCDLIIGSFVSPKKIVKKEALSNAFKLVNRATELTILSCAQARFKDCDFVFVPQELSNFSLFDTGEATRIYQIGYEFASRNMENLFSAIRVRQGKKANPC